MLRKVIALVRRATSNQPPKSRVPAPAATARRDRAETVLSLQGEVRTLRQEIKDASDAQDGVGRIAALEADFHEKQRELAGLQGRV